MGPLGRALCGALAAATGLGVGELVAGALLSGSPVVAVGQTVIELGPPAIERMVIDWLGTADKPALVITTVVVAVVLGALAGLVDRRRSAVVVGATAALAAWAAVRAEDASLVHGVAPLAGGAAAWLVLRLLVRPPATTDAPLQPFERDRRLLLAGGAAVTAAFTTGLGRMLADRVDAAGARAKVALPRPATPLVTPSRVEVGLAGVTPWRTPNADFYRIDVSLLVPQVDPDEWTLRITGLVDEPLSLRYDELLARPTVEADVTLVCVSNEVGGDLVGNARWLGVPLRALLDEAGPRSGADQIVGRSVDGFTAGFPLAAALDGRDALVAVGMNGEPLPLRHGFPARLVVGGLYGYVSATKWLDEIELTRFADFDPYWIKRGWDRAGVVKPMARIDTPRRKAAPGRVEVGGVAWAQGRGVAGVEVRVDEGRWHEAALGDAVGDDTWRQWRWSWTDASPGRHVLEARAITDDGFVQRGERMSPFPSGATGWHSVGLRVA